MRISPRCLVIFAIWSLSTAVACGGSSDIHTTDATDGSDATTTSDTVSSSISFQIDPGYRINFASNPRVISYESGTLGLGYEYQAKELLGRPSERGYIAFTTDGTTFTGNRAFEPGESGGPGTKLANGDYRRYFPSQEKCGFISEFSKDRKSWTAEDGVRHDLSVHDACHAGVFTVYVDASGGVNLLYNSSEKDPATGNEIIYVRRAHSSDNGVSFTYRDDDLLKQKDAKGRVMSMADPNALVLADGRVLLVVMNQDADSPKPPLGRTGDIYGFVSADGVTPFEALGKLFSWESFTAFEVRSLNDPKVFQFDNGVCKLFVAAMVPVEAGESYPNPYKYVMISATWSPQ